MSEEDNIRIVEKYYEALNAHDVRRLTEYQAPGYTLQAPGLPGPVGASEDAAYIQGFFDAFPDLRFELTQKIAQDDLVVVNWVGKGTHKGPLRTPTGASLPATGKQASTLGSNTIEFENGKVLHSWVYFDMATLLAQLGLMPGM
jgi:steroid delta-isomerase-like uncharacterized protein